jgi:hypothetical protein
VIAMGLEDMSINYWEGRVETLTRKIGDSEDTIQRIDFSKQYMQQVKVDLEQAENYLNVDGFTIDGKPIDNNKIADLIEDCDNIFTKLNNKRTDHEGKIRDWNNRLSNAESKLRELNGGN